jgi:hypothetical protein
MIAFLGACPGDLFGRARVVVDVGGGHGSSLLAVVRRFPNVRGINFDLPHVIALAPPCPGCFRLSRNRRDQMI